MAAVNALRPMHPAKGDATWEDLDDDDFGALLNASDASAPVVRRKGSTTIFSRLSLYSKYKASNFRDKIAIETEIEQYKQYLWQPIAVKTITGDGLNLRPHYTTAVRMVEGYPNNVRPSTVSMLIDSSLEGMTIGNAVVIECVSLGSVVTSKS